MAPPKSNSPAPLQDQRSIEKNTAFFLEEHQSYALHTGTLDTYVTIRDYTTKAVDGVTSLLDIGNGGVFDYDTSVAGHIVALDLFLEELPPDYKCPPNVTLLNGSALDIPKPDASFDGALMVMLLHHLIGKSVAESIANMEVAFREAWRCLQPGGRLVVVESCVPYWFYGFERAVFRAASAVIGALISHPATLQYPPALVEETIRKVCGVTPETVRIPKGKWVLQFGRKFPAALTPVIPCRFVARKPAD